MASRDRLALHAWLRSGCVALTGRAGGPPRVPPGDAALRAAEAAAVFGVDGAQLLGERAALLGLTRNGPWSAGGTCRALRARDGWWALSLARDDDLAAVPALVEGSAVDRGRDGAWRAVGRWARRRDLADVVARTRLLGLPAGPVRERRASRPGVRVEAVGAHGPRPRVPLVVDLSSLWAGPLCAHLLGRAGARIVKVESVHRPDGARRGERRFYDLLHGGHEAVALDLRDREGITALHALLRAADIVIEASRPRALAQLGVDVTAVLDASPTTWVRITAYGGAEPDRIGFGDDVAMVAGLVVDDRRAPVPCGDALADPLAGIAAAASARDEVARPRSALVDVSMVDLVHASLGRPAPAPLRRRSGTWFADGEPVSAPTARPVGAPAPALGEHTAAVLAELAAVP
jgi:crotonobetainyl-CoA:carnitine CoA-transferase CaiB-like acyl-CoA transferase